MKLILLGPPGSGKGTVAKKVAQDFDLEHLSTGDIFRAEIRAGTDLGQLADFHISQGHLVPDEVTIPIIQQYLDRDIIFDGYPRTVPQAEALEEVLISGVIYLNVPDESIIERISNRRICEECGTPYNLIHIPPKKEGICDNEGGVLLHRKDDTQEIVKGRLLGYHHSTIPLLEFYGERNLLNEVDGSQKPDLVYATVKELVKSLQP